MKLKFNHWDLQIGDLDYLYEAIEYAYFGLGVFRFDQSISGGQ